MILLERCEIVLSPYILHSLIFMAKQYLLMAKENVPKISRNVKAFG
jgi:hypothetical protein